MPRLGQCTIHPPGQRPAPLKIFRQKPARQVAGLNEGEVRRCESTAPLSRCAETPQTRSAGKGVWRDIFLLLIVIASNASINRFATFPQPDLVFSQSNKAACNEPCPWWFSLEKCLDI
jgi:hypothetical protein